ncbi:MAG: tetratricopeptide repeat protein, partial [Prosthecobacter sp.]|nr:tetratricopeptide repeat protein [Prosthecobacter sp.]
MAEVHITIETLEDGNVVVTLQFNGNRHEHRASPEAVSALVEATTAWRKQLETRQSSLTDPVLLSDLGKRLRDTLLGSKWEALQAFTEIGSGRLLVSTPRPDLLNLPWELLPAEASAFLVSDGRWAIRRSTLASPPPPSLSRVALPLRILFVACSPRDQTGLDFEREEETMLRLVAKLGPKIHLDIAESGTFEELRNLISELKPHVVHLSGHGVVEGDEGYFTFEDERGDSDSRDATSMAQLLFANRDLHAVFVSGCQTAVAAGAGMCQALTASGHVPVALGWGASVSDHLATEFARVFYHELAAGRSLDASLATARQELFAQSLVQDGDQVFLNATFALPQMYVSDATDHIVDESLPWARPHRPGISYELLGDNIIGLREGFVGRRRLLQKLRPDLRDGAIQVLLLTGIGGAGKSTLATRLANRCQQEGFRIVAVKAFRKDASSFALRLLEEMSVACQRLGRISDESMLLDGNRPTASRLRLVIEILKECKILLVMDNLEDLMPLPPANPDWESDDLKTFFRHLLSRMTGAGRCILTCRYVPESFDATLPGLIHEPLPDFSEAEFLKCLRRLEKVTSRIASGEISRQLLTLLHRKIGGTPRFIKEAADVLAVADLTKLEAELQEAPDPSEDDSLRAIREKYLNDLFLPDLYEALTIPQRLGLSRFAVTELPLPLDGVVQVAGMQASENESFVSACIARGLMQRMGESHETTRYTVYPLHREFLTDSARFSPSQAQSAHQAAALFLKTCFEQDREKDLQIHFMAELLTCFQHAQKGHETDLIQWACVAIARFLNHRQEFQAVVDLLEPLVDTLPSTGILTSFAQALKSLGEWGRARNLYARSLEMLQAIGDQRGEATTWHQLAGIELSEGRYDEAREKFARSLEMRQAIEDQAGEAATWHQLATIDIYEGRYDEARDKFARSLKMLQTIGDRAGEAATWHNLASIEVKEGRYDEARDKFARSLKMLQTIGDRAGEAATWHNLASIEVKEGRYDEARDKFARSLELQQTIGTRAGEAATLAQISFLAWENDQKASGMGLQAIAYSILKTIGSAERIQVWENLTSMASELELTQDQFDDTIKDAISSYASDRGAALVAKAFEG